MHLIPTRQGRSGDDPIFALNDEARARAAAGETVVNATLGALLHDDGTLAILPTAAEAVQAVDPIDWAAYAPIEGLPAFLDGVQADVWGTDTTERAQSIAVVTPGGTGALRHAIATFLEPGQAFLTTDFHWSPYETLAEEQERRIDTFPMFAARDALDLDALGAALTRHVEEQGRALLLLNDPCHNPAGYSMSAADWAGVCERVEALAARAPITVVLDNAYAAFGPAGAMDTARAALIRLSDCALPLVAWSASKSFTHYGMRTGALVALVPDEEERRAVEGALSTACRGTWGNCNRGGQVAIGRLLTDPTLRPQVDAERRALVELLDARVAAWNEAAADTALRYPRYRGGFFTTVFCDDAEAAAAALREDGIFVVPVPGGLRVGLCALPTTQVASTVRALARVLAQA